jgi:type IV secretion system protein TrbI
MTTAPLSTEAPAPDLSLRARPPSPKRLSRKVVLAGIIGAGLIVAFALVNGLTRPAPQPREAAETAQTAVAGPPDTIRLAQSHYGAGDLSRGRFEASEIAAADGGLAAPEDPIWLGGEAPQAAVSPAASAEVPVDPEATARASPILFGAERAARAEARDLSDMRLDARLVPPRSRYELQAGHVIPAALVTALNSDLPGQIIAQVTAPVYDSVTGEHLLIPQGARLIGVYRSGGSHGDNRLFLSWTRLILPDGWSIPLRDMPGADGEGASGVRDRVDNHLGRLAAAIGLSAVISVIANNAEDDDDASLSQSVGDAAAQQAAGTGARIVERELAVRPTIRVRAGAPVRVLVTRDIALRPYVERAPR